MKRILLIFIILNSIFLITPLGARAQDATPLLWRSAKTLTQGGILIWDSLFYADLTEKYDWNKKDWVDLSGDYSKFTSLTMFGYGITDQLEILGHIPIHRWTSAGESTTGIGDMSLQIRYLLNNNSKSWPFVNIYAFVRFPTGDDEESPAVGDGTTDFALGTNIQTQKIGKFSGLLKMGYVFNGKDDADIDLGDEFRYCLKANYHLKKSIILSCNLMGIKTYKKKDADGNKIENTRKNRLYVVPMVIWSPVKGLKIKPKLKVPIRSECKGGNLFDVQYILECYYCF